jgi:SpoVK/Ycf46/Vps4 family AAA+-type ATPase
MDVGELDRIVVGLMQELDLSKPNGIIIGATNLSKNLDEAFWRRFDLQMEFPKPRSTEVLSYARRLSKTYSIVSA